MTAPENFPRKPPTPYRGSRGISGPGFPESGGFGEFRGNQSATHPNRWRIAQAAYIAHTLTCPTCTAAARLPGAQRCPAGAGMWATYLAALPDRTPTETRPTRDRALQLPQGIEPCP